MFEMKSLTTLFFLFTIFRAVRSVILLSNGSHNCRCYSRHASSFPDVVFHNQHHTTTTTPQQPSTNTVDHSFSSSQNPLSVRNLILTADHHCSHPSQPYYLICCTQYIREDLNFCCLPPPPSPPSPPSSPSSPSSSAPPSSPSPPSSSSPTSSSSPPSPPPPPLIVNIPPINTSEPLRNIPNCLFSTGQKKVIQEAFQISSTRHTVLPTRYRYILAMCMVYPIFVIIIFLASFYSTSQLTYPLPTNLPQDMQGRRWSFFGNIHPTTQPPQPQPPPPSYPPPSYTSIDPPSYHRHQTNAPSLPQQQHGVDDAEVVIGGHPGVFQETLQAESSAHQPALQPLPTNFPVSGQT